MFDQDASEGDKVQQVMAALEAVRREVSNPYEMNLEEMTQYVTAEMYQKYLEAPTVKGAEARTQERGLDKRGRVKRPFLCATLAPYAQEWPRSPHWRSIIIIYIPLRFPCWQ